MRAMRAVFVQAFGARPRRRPTRGGGREATAALAQRAPSDAARPSDADAEGGAAATAAAAPLPPSSPPASAVAPWLPSISRLLGWRGPSAAAAAATAGALGGSDDDDDDDDGSDDGDGDDRRSTPSGEGWGASGGADRAASAAESPAVADAAARSSRAAGARGFGRRRARVGAAEAVRLRRELGAQLRFWRAFYSSHSYDRHFLEFSSATPFAEWERAVGALEELCRTA
jgi:hypothetical protein